MRATLQKWGDSAVFVMTSQMRRDYDLEIGDVYDIELAPSKKDSQKEKVQPASSPSGDFHSQDRKNESKSKTK